jgi:hypothetical protein
MAGYEELLERLKRLKVGVGEAGQVVVLLEAACLASTGDLEACRLLADRLRDRASLGDRLDAEEVRKVLDEFELVGSCLVERGVEVDPSACRGEALLIVGRRGAALLHQGSAAGLALGGECAVAIGEANLLKVVFLRHIAGLKPVEEGVLDYDWRGAVVGIGACKPEQLAALAERLGRAAGRYWSLHEECSAAAKKSVDARRILEEEVEECRRLLRGGGR